MNPIQRETFEAWLFAQPRERTYIYLDNRDCLICKFLKETTSATNPYVGDDNFTLVGGAEGERIKFPDWLNPYKGSKLILPACSTLGELQDFYLDIWPETLSYLVKDKIDTNDDKQNKPKETNDKHNRNQPRVAEPINK